MRITTFNMRQGGSLTHWSKILDATEPDLLLVQETRDPQGMSHDLVESLDLRSALWSPVHHGQWGSALLVRGGEVRRVPVPGFEGWVEGGRVPLGDVETHVFSVHLPPQDGSYVKAAHQVLDALAPFVAGGSLILGGDWNVTVSAGPTEARLASHAAGMELLARLEEDFGLRSAWDLANPDERPAQTLRWARNPATPYHCDGIFLPSELAESVHSAVVLDGSPWTELSDHNPVVVEVSGPAGAKEVEA